jgi:hypothetical protein
MSAKRLNSWNSFSRKPREPELTGRSILIVTEGKETEPKYFSGLRNHLKLSSVEVKIMKAGGTDALSIVDYAIDKRKERKLAAKHECTVPYDSVWAVFDTERADTNPKLKEALNKAGVHKINVALSNPCFEFWLLLHDVFTTAPFINCDDVIRCIKRKYVPNYQKNNIPMGTYIPKIPTAVHNAEQCQNHHNAAGTDIMDRNPSTKVHLLVCEMNKATRVHSRLF